MWREEWVECVEKRQSDVAGGIDLTAVAESRWWVNRRKFAGQPRNGLGGV